MADRPDEFAGLVPVMPHPDAAGQMYEGNPPRLTLRGRPLFLPRLAANDLTDPTHQPGRTTE